MEITCDIAMDLVDIYTSGVASEGTSEAVKAHLKNCKDCRSFYDGYKKSMVSEPKKIQIETSPNITEELLGESVKKLSRRLRTRRIISNITNGVALTLGAVVVIKEVAEMLGERKE